jgi:hypothetical protein
LQDIAITIEENEELLRGSFGEDALPSVVRELQDECETRGAQILRQYCEYRKLARHAKDVTAQKPAGGGTTEGIDPREVEVYLEEMLLLTQQSEEYSQVGRRAWSSWDPYHVMIRFCTGCMSCARGCS